ncbi:1951_t:CDS:2 [Cetraspora pellucida]|uniref:1951_t:CDS:1 n=1 Tax=Cetraspora pellucida TaxID=1433469 RepID=A0A9N9J7W5_9GLOM|nr:1951_t:CDS:2 [Cetraspora pellucida]
MDHIHAGGLIKSGVRMGVNMYLDNKAKKTCERILKDQFQKLVNQGYLSVIGKDGFQLTDKALNEQIGLMAYSDVRTYMQTNNFNVEEIAIVTRTRVQIWLNKKYQSWDKRVGGTWPKTADFARRMRQRSSDALNQAAIGNNPNALMIVTRIIGLAQMCGISEIGLVDIIEGLSMSYIFETIGRLVVATMRGQHPSEVYNIGLGIRGSTENVHKNFAMEAGGFKGPREVIGKYIGGRVTLNSIVAEVVLRNHLNEGEEIWCMSGWAEALRRRTIKLREDASRDIHGNLLRCTNRLKVILSIKRVRGVPLAKIKRVGPLRAADLIWGGITGAACLCTNPDPLKKIKGGDRVGKLKISFKKLDPLSMKPIPRHTIIVHETYGDGIAHLFLSHCLTKQQELDALQSYCNSCNQRVLSIETL